MPKKIAQDVTRQVRELGEEVIKETARQPAELAKRAVEQILPRGWGEELGAPPSESQLSTRLIQEKKEEEEEKLAFARKRIKEMTPKPSQPVSEEAPEEEVEEAKKMKPLEEPEAKKPRGLPPGAERRIKKRRGTREVKVGM